MPSSAYPFHRSKQFADINIISWPLLLLFVVALPLSIAAASVILTVLVFLWVASANFRYPTEIAPTFFWPLSAYAVWTLITVIFSVDPMTSLIESKEVLLYLVIPIVFQLARGERAATVATLVLTVGAVTATIGIVQFGILEYDNLGQRPSGSMGHYMTYSGLLMLMINVAVARVLFDTRERMWAVIVLPALVVALALTLTRSAWVGTVIGVGILLVLKNVRLLAVAPAALLLVIFLAPTQITNRIYSVFDLQNATNRDRLAMATVGVGMIKDHPVTGVGPEMIQVMYEDYRPPNAVNALNQHLHNVPLQIAAERGIPALALWLWFVGAVVVDLVKLVRRKSTRGMAAAGLATVASMVAAGMFEYNFGDSEFLMLLLVLITLPTAAAVTENSDVATLRTS
jgi:O-antigen ligase